MRSSSCEDDRSESGKAVPRTRLRIGTLRAIFCHDCALGLAPVRRSTPKAPTTVAATAQVIEGVDLMEVRRRPSRAGRVRVYAPRRDYDDATATASDDGLFLYLRLSRVHADGADAIERQRIDLLRLLKSQGRCPVGEFVDNDTARGVAGADRRGWRALNEAIAEGEVRAVAFWKIDRLYRATGPLLQWFATCHARGVELISHQDSAGELNAASAGAKLITGVKALFAEIESDTISERQKAAKRHAADAGFFSGGVPPFGWVPGPRVVDELGRSGRRLVPEPVEHAALTAAVRMVLDGHSLADVCRCWRDEFGIVTATGDRLPASSLRQFLCSPRMAGYRVHHRPAYGTHGFADWRSYVVTGTDGVPLVTQEPVCDEATWLQVREVLQQRQMTASPKVWLLSGLLRCPGCGRGLYGVTKQTPTAGGVSVRRVYRCRTRTRPGGACPAGVSVDAARAEAFVIGWFHWLCAPGALADARAELAAQNLGGVEDQVTAELADARIERHALLARQGSAEFAGEQVVTLLQLVQDVDRRILRLENRLRRLRPTEPVEDVAVHDDVVARWPDLEPSQQRNLLRVLISHVDVAYGHAPVPQRLTVVPVFDAARRR